jgi:hypothetical protein
MRFILPCSLSSHTYNLVHEFNLERAIIAEIKRTVLDDWRTPRTEIASINSLWGKGHTQWRSVMRIRIHPAAVAMFYAIVYPLSISMISSLMPSSSAYTKPLAVSDNPLVDCSYFNALSPPEGIGFARGFFAASTMGQPLVWLAVRTRRTFYDDLTRYCRLYPGARLNSVAGDVQRAIWLSR